MQPTILFFTTMTWPFPARLAAAFAQCGARIEALCPRASPLTQLRQPAPLHRYNPLAPAASLARARARCRPDMVIPCDDRAASLLAEPIARPDLLACAAKAGIQIAATLPLADEAALAQAITGLGLPLVLKQEGSWGGEGVRIAATGEAARAALRDGRRRLRDGLRALRRRESWLLTRAFYPLAANFSAQRFIAGLPATSSIACWQGELVAALHFDVRASAGPTGPATVVARADCAQMQEAAQRIAGIFNLSGLFGLDYIRDRHGNVHLLEMNARATPTGHLALNEDLPAALLRAAGWKAHPRPPVTTAREIALFPGEWLRDPFSPRLHGAYHDVPWDEPNLVRAVVRGAPATAARALLETLAKPDLMEKTALSRA